MPEHIRALVVILVLTTPVWWIARNAFSELLPSSTFARWRNLWFLVTLALFLSHNYWLFAFLLVSMVMAARRKEVHVVGLYFVLLFAGLPSQIQVPGFGFINYLMDVSHYILLTLALLLPTAIVLMRSSHATALGKGPLDPLLLAYLILVSVLGFRDTSLTNGFRLVVTNLIEVFLPYYVLSRSIRDIEGFKLALSGFIIAVCLLATLAIFESVVGWLLYQRVQFSLGLNPYGWMPYMERAGLLRSNASLGHPIPLGFVFMVALGFMLFISRNIAKDWQRWLAWGSLVLGLISSLSRGPWVGAALIGLMASLRLSKSLQNFFKAGLLVSFGGIVLANSTIGQKIISVIPFFGEIETGSVDYRVELWSFVYPVFERSFWFGSPGFRESPELQFLASIQGQGIPDLVNHYFHVLLSSGVVGLALFCGILLRALYAVLFDSKNRFLDHEHAMLGFSLLATLLSTVLVIATMSFISVIPFLFWSILGLCSAYSTLVASVAKRDLRKRMAV